MTEIEYINARNIQHLRAIQWHLQGIMPEESDIDREVYNEVTDWIYDLLDKMQVHLSKDGA